MASHMKIPRVSVLLPTHNSESFIAEAITSILNQSYKNFEFIIIDDGSTDGTRKILSQFSDPRIRIIEHPRNLGIVRSLNDGIVAAKGKYIMRMDADDISMPQRIEKQLEFMEKNLDVGLCGSCMEVFGEKNYIWKAPETDLEIKTRLFFESPIAHPTVCIRKSILDKNQLIYKKDYQYVEDYKLWMEMSKVTKIGNIQEVLLKYRMHRSQIGVKKAKEQVKMLNKVLLENIQELIPSVKDSDMSIHVFAMSWPTVSSYSKLLILKNWYEKLITANNSRKLYDLDNFTSIVVERWVGACYLAKNLGMPRYLYLLSSIPMFIPSLRYMFMVRKDMVVNYLSRLSVK